MLKVFLINPAYSGWVTLLLLFAAVCLQAGSLHAAQSLRVGFSRSVIGDVNENDALAVIKVWAKALVVKENLSVDPQPKIYKGIREIETALREKQIECVSITADEFFKLQHLLDRNKFIFPVRGGSMTEEYLLLVRQESHISKIPDLKGGTLEFSRNSSTALSTTWLDVELAKAGLLETESFFGRLVPVKKVSAAVLPVFFKKADACLVTRKGFETMAELNPQISKQLKILLASGEYVPNFFGFRDDYQHQLKETILKRIEHWDQTTAGRQILTIFQTDALRHQTFDDLSGTLELIRQYHQLYGSEMDVN